jgi:hypothetical protein
MLSHAADRCRFWSALVIAGIALTVAVQPATAAPRVIHARLVHLRGARTVHPFRNARHGSHRRHATRAPTRTGRRAAAHAAATFANGGYFNGSGEGSCCVDPPQISGSVSTTQFVQVDASNVSVFNRSTGALLQKASLATFCPYLSGGSEGRIIYDQEEDRWYFIGVSGNGTTMCLGVSVTDDATGAWYDAGLAAAVPTGGFALNPMIGYDQDAILFTTDGYTSAGNFNNGAIYAVNKALAVVNRDNFVNAYGAPAGPVVPPIVDDFTPLSSYFLGATPSGSSLILYQGTELDHTPGTLTVTSVPVPAYSAPPPASQPGTADTLNAGNASFQSDSTEIGDSLFNVQGIAVNGHPGIRWYQINAASNTLASYGRVSSASTSDDLDPSMAVGSANGSLTDYFTWTTTNTRDPKPANQHAPEMALGIRAAGDPLNVGAISHSGPGTNYDPAPGENGWGLSQVSIDPVSATGCPVGGRAVAIGAMGQTTHLWRSRIWRFGEC